MSMFSRPGERMPFIQKLMDAGIIPPMTTDFTLRFPLNGIIEVTYRCHASEELLTEDVGSQIVQDIDAVGAAITREPAKEAT